MRQIIWALVIALPLVFLPGVVAQQSQQELGTVTYTDSVAQADIEAYWTDEKMASAVPMTPPERLFDEYAAQSGSDAMPYATPGGVNGWDPSTGPYVEQRMTSPAEVPQLLTAPQAFGTAPTNPLAGPYGPFQRYAMQGRYMQFPRSIHGKLFFTLGASNFVCSGTVIGRSTIATAGHCVSDGSGVFASNFLFCPSYIHPSNAARGCWAWSSVTTSGQWHNSKDPDYDYACIVAPVTGTVVANKIGNVTGWAGRAWNWVDVPVMTFGYPQGAPFTGRTIQQTASVEWYNWNATAGGQVSKVIGSDLTGGSSGGGWFLSWRHPSDVDERPDTDNNPNTDPAGALNGPFINGMNSHKRCAGGTCASPPTAAAGVFWQEMTSPPFRATAATNESEDVFASCLGQPNNAAAAPATAKR